MLTAIPSIYSASNPFFSLRSTHTLRGVQPIESSGYHEQPCDMDDQLVIREEMTMTSVAGSVLSNVWACI